MSLEADGLDYDMSVETENTKYPILKKSTPFIIDNNSSSNFSTNEVIFDGLTFSNSGQWADYRNGYIVLPLVIIITDKGMATVYYVYYNG